MENTLTTENVLARIDYFQTLLAPEVTRERQRWGDSYDQWVWNIDYMRDFLTNHDHMGGIVDNLVRYIGLTEKEIDTYFRRWRS